MNKKVQLGSIGCPDPSFTPIPDAEGEPPPAEGGCFDLERGRNVSCPPRTRKCGYWRSASFSQPRFLDRRQKPRQRCEVARARVRRAPWRRRETDLVGPCSRKQCSAHS